MLLRLLILIMKMLDASLTSGDVERMGIDLMTMIVLVKRKRIDELVVLLGRSADERKTTIDASEKMTILLRRNGNARKGVKNAEIDDNASQNAIQETERSGQKMIADGQATCPIQIATMIRLVQKTSADALTCLTRIETLTVREPTDANQVIAMTPIHQLIDLEANGANLVIETMTHFLRIGLAMNDASPLILIAIATGIVSVPNVSHRSEILQTYPTVIVQEMNLPNRVVYLQIQRSHS